MKILVSAALGALALVAPPASAQLYKAGTVTATPRVESKDRSAAGHRHEKPPAQIYHKPGTPTFMQVRLRKRPRACPWRGAPSTPV